MKYISLILLLLACFLGQIKGIAAPIKVLATTSFLADMAKNVAGEAAVVESLIPLGGDPHTYEPIPSDVQRVVQADVILKNGLTLEGWLDEMLENAGTTAEIVTVTKGITPIQSAEHEGAYDPHAWMSAKNGLIYLENIKNALIATDAKNTALYQKNYLAYQQKLIALDQEITTKVAQIPAAQRVLITSHDAFHYFGNQYGMRVESVLGTSTDAEVQMQDIQKLSEIIRRDKVPAVFIESTINPKLMRQLSSDNSVKVGGKLFADSLGEEGSGAETYLDMLRHNVNTILAGLTGKQESAQKREGTPFSFFATLLVIFAFSFIWVARKLKNTSTEVTDWGKYVISVNGISVTYDKKAIFSNLYLTIESGFIYGLIGGNGSGKSTLMKSIMGVVEPDTGEVLIHQKPIDEVRKYIAYVPQKEEIDWNFPATVIDVVMMGRYPHKAVFEAFSEKDKQLATEALQKMGIADLVYRQIGELSGGQQQRVFIARALCQEAEVFLLDEPFVGVDITTEEKIMEIMKQEAKNGKLVVIIHHDLSRVRDYFGRLIMMNQRIVAVGDTEEVLTDENLRQTYGGSPAILDLVRRL
ncbi:MAG: metal ABC transporter solute-binding protein, Zn/Mn family [Bacteroidia bacterium]